MPVAVKTESVPQPVQTVHPPAVSTQSEAQPLAFSKYHPQQVKVAVNTSVVKNTIGGLAAVAGMGMGLQCIRNRRREQLNRERDRLWREDALQLKKQLAG